MERPGQQSPSPGSETTGFVKARRVRSFDDVVEQVRTSIADGAIPAGQRLPSEREMAEQFGVSRATLREALRALEALGILEIRLGAQGGAFAAEPSERFAAPLRELFGDELTRRPNDYRRFRASMHADNARWAHLADADLADLAEHGVRGEGAFLTALARATHQTLRLFLAEAIEGINTSVVASSPLTPERIHQVMDLLRSSKSADAGDLLFELLIGDHTTELPQ